MGLGEGLLQQGPHVGDRVEEGGLEPVDGVVHLVHGRGGAVQDEARLPESGELAQERPVVLRLQQVAHALEGGVHGPAGGIGGMGREHDGGREALHGLAQRPLGHAAALEAGEQRAKSPALARPSRADLLAQLADVHQLHPHGERPGQGEHAFRREPAQLRAQGAFGRVAVPLQRGRLPHHPLEQAGEGGPLLLADHRGEQGTHPLDLRSQRRARALASHAAGNDNLRQRTADDLRSPEDSS